MPTMINASVLDTGIDENILKQLEDWGRFLAERTPGRLEMSTSQIRRFFGEIKRIQADFENNAKDVLLLDPKIAYAVGRASRDAGQRSAAIGEFYKMVSPLIRSIRMDKMRYSHFVHVCESIVAYHKVYGGK
ncbi:type III-A CRISPR-associated protein Csm2 [Flavihumibacter profundi]|uniref:type III-A CRISPR-associated protein Csm2 n=1 Tax=Flavihumibacter profundi TaxID=2716883 RepID=UPI001CC580DC|nr:type III-A CRISPR-associated protein Csm2 [Flavihumibacter profundi]MBZ5857561.1 type III-A CRISPR-associated protein Csm2 [Flavihumibacter profundi]